MRKNQMLHYVYVLVGIYFVLVTLLYVFQRALIYFPTSAYQHNYQRIALENDNEKIDIIVLNAGKENGFIYFGGNAEAVIANAADFTVQFPNQTIYLVNYRGYGGSTGKPTESGLFSDAIAIYDHLISRHQSLAVVGRSLGSGVAMYLAANRPVNRLVLITPYDSVLALAKKQFPLFPISLLLKDQYDSLSLAKDVKAPVLIIAGDQDRLIPVVHSEKLFNEFGSGIAQMVVIAGAGHNDISGFDQFYKSMICFFEN